MAVQRSDLDFWSEALFKEHRDLIVDDLNRRYSSWKSMLVSDFREDTYMRYASYYAVILNSQHFFLSPVMGVSNSSRGRKRGYVCVHPFGIRDALYLIRKFVDDFSKESSELDYVFDETKVIDRLDSFMKDFLPGMFIERRYKGDDFDFEDEGVDSFFYDGSWLIDISFDFVGGYFTKECDLPCEYHTPFGTWEDYRTDVFGFIIIPREEMFELLEKQGLVIRNS